MVQVREPVKKTSIATKQKIIEKGFELICKEGYHHINCADIAKFAGVSTGSIYQYFSNKKDILTAGMNEYLTKIMFPMINTRKKITNKEELIDEIIKFSIKNHKKYKIHHEELVALIHQDPELAKLYQENEWQITKEVVKYLEQNNINLKNPLEKTHIILNMIDNLSHELVYHHHKELEEQALIEEIKEIIKNIIK